MNQSFRIGSVFGITVRVHVMLPILIVFFLLQRPDALGQSLLLVATLMTTVFLHELGHSLMAQRHGIKVVDIVFWPLGGLARMSEIPQDWKIESQIAFAGPAVNFALAALAAPFALLFDGALANDYALPFLLINLALGVFNLIPVFPMDGARVLRALLARDSDWLSATERTASLGRSLAMLFPIAGLFFSDLGGCIMGALFGIWFWWSCMQEVLSVRMRNLRSAFETGGGSPFGPGGSPFGPGANPFSAFGRRPEPSPDEPDAWHDDPAAKKGGFSSKDVEDLENFRGSLRQRRDDA